MPRRRPDINRAELVKRAVVEYPTSDEIAARAHELFISSGRSLKDLREHWRAAEQELLERSALRAVRQASALLPSRLDRRAR